MALVNEERYQAAYKRVNAALGIYGVDAEESAAARVLRDKVIEELEVDLDQARPQLAAPATDDGEDDAQPAEPVETDWAAIEAEIV